MSENIKPSEVSEVLLQQLKGIDTHLQFDEVGKCAASERWRSTYLRSAQRGSQ